MLRRIAFEMACGQPATNDLIEYCIGLANPDLDTPEIADCVPKLATHPLIERASGTDQWVFKEEQTAIILVADAILTAEPHLRKQHVSAIKLQEGQVEDLATTLVDLVMLASPDRDSQIALLAALVRSFMQVSEEEGRESRLAASLALTAVERLTPKGKTKE